MASYFSSFMTTLMACLAVGFFLFLSLADAREFLFDGKDNAWTIPDFPDEFNNWAKRLRFQVGDSIVVRYNSTFDSILQVSEKDYLSCNISNPIKTYSDGTSKIVFEESGAFFFISGALGHCERGQKLEVKVLSTKHGGDFPGHHHEVYAPAPSPTGYGHGHNVEFSTVALLLGIFIVLIMV